VSASIHKNHPDYGDGYWDGLDGKEPQRDDAAYRDGHSAGAYTKSLLLGSGFTQTGPDQFSKTTVLK